MNFSDQAASIVLPANVSWELLLDSSDPGLHGSLHALPESHVGKTVTLAAWCAAVFGNY
jgi:hypothetical protein